MKSSLYRWCGFVALLFSTFGLVGQVSTGLPPRGSFSGGPDVMNLGNLNVHFEIPVFAKPGRGTPFSYTLSLDSSVWTQVNTSGTTSWQPVANWGWRAITEAATGYISRQRATVRCQIPDSFPPRYYNAAQSYNFQYHDGFGIIHTGFENIVGGCPDDYDPSDSVSTDSSGLTLHTGGSATITSRDGANLTPPVDAGTGVATRTDRNGNQITTTNGNTFTDTLGMTVLNISGGAPNPLTFTYTDSSGTPRTVTMNYSTYTVQTNFGCSGVSEYGPSTGVSLVSSINLPDGSSYSFTYEPTPGAGNNVTGRVKSITLRTGATIAYTYTGGNNGIICADGSTAGLARVDNNGTTTYSRSGSGTSWTTTATDAQGNQEVINFQTATPTGISIPNFYETHRTVSQGGTTMLLQTDTCYNNDASAPNCSGTTITLPLTQIVRYVTLNNNQQSSTGIALNSFGLPTAVDEHDFGSGTTGGLLRRTLTSYASLGNGIVDRPSSITVQDGSGNQKALTSFGYDETAVVATSGVPQHIAISGSRGNPTSLSRWLDTTNSNLASTFTYDDTGNPLTGTDPGGHQTQFSYTDNFSDGINRNSLAYRTQVTLPDTNAPNLANHVMKSLYDANTGQTVTFWDQNNNQTSFTYDSMLRLVQTIFPDGGQTTLNYPDAATVEQLTKIDAAQTDDLFAYFDNYGRPIRIKHITPSGNVYVDTTYDVLGNVATVTNPYFTTTDTTYGVTQMQYDALGRLLKATRPDGSFRTMDYTTAPACTVVIDEAGRKRKSCNDGLGRLSAVWEDPGGLNFETDYQYDTLDNLLRVDQKGSALSDSTMWRPRTFTYDSLSRPLGSTNPESGATNYTYDADSNIITKTAPAPNQAGGATVTTTYSYDALNRITGKTYSDSTPSAYYHYDETAPWNWPIPNPIGHLTTEGSGSIAQVFLYDSMGRIIQNGQCTPSNCAYWMTYTYNLGGDLTSFTNPDGVRVSKSFDSAGRVTQITSSMSDAYHPATLATIDPVTGYYPSDAVRKITLGNGLSETAAYNNNLEPCRLNVNSSGATLAQCGDNVPSGNVQDFNYGFNSGLSDNGNVVSVSATGTQAFNRTYGYDQLNRLQTMSSPGDTCSGLSWNYDSWGNRTDQTVTGGSCGPWHVGFDAQNRLLGSPFQYDAAGNLINDGNHSYTYDAENRLTKVDGGATATYVYDAHSRRAIKTAWGIGTDYIYDLGGSVVSEYGGGCAVYAGSVCWNIGYIYLNSGVAAQYRNGTTYFAHKDHLGSTRLVTTMGGVISESDDYLPFGERINDPGNPIILSASFEGNSANGWALGYWGATSFVTNTLAFYGSYSLAQTGATTGGSFQDVSGLTPGQSYQVSVWVRADAGTTAQAYLWLHDTTGANSENTAAITPGQSWQVLALTYTANSTGKVRIHLHYLAGAGTIYYDVVQIKPNLPGNVLTHKFTGDEHDSETNTEHTWFRQYSCNQGRWTTPDPYLGSMNLTNPQSLNRYTYVTNNPMNATDPQGLDPCFIVVFGWNDHRDKNGVGQYSSLVPDAAAAYPYDKNGGFLGNLGNTMHQSLVGPNGGTYQTANLINYAGITNPGGIIVVGYSGGVQDVSTAVQSGLVTPTALGSIAASINISPGLGLGGSVVHLGNTQNFRGGGMKDRLATFVARDNGLQLTKTTGPSGKTCGHNFKCEFSSPEVQKALGGARPCPTTPAPSDGGGGGGDGSLGGLDWGGWAWWDFLPPCGCHEWPDDGCCPPAEDD